MEMFFVIFVLVMRYCQDGAIPTLAVFAGKITVENIKLGVERKI